MKNYLPPLIVCLLFFGIMHLVKIERVMTNPFIQVSDTLFVQEHEVTVSEYRQFADQTEAERLGVSVVFQVGPDTVWKIVKNASWKKNDGRKKSKWNHPVTHLTISEMQDYCDCIGGRLMTLEEFNQIYQGPEEEGNVWEGLFPFRNTLEDGYEGIAPVKSYKKNVHGLYDLKGNVWEVTSTKSEQDQEEFYMAGGSYICGFQGCLGYRFPQLILSSTTISNMGFRCVMDKQMYCNVYD